MVSNGRDVLLTDHDGRWRCETRPGDHIFVIKPTGWAAPTFSVLVSYEEPPRSVDFGLRPQQEASRFEAVLLADTQPQTMLELTYLRDSILHAVSGCQAAFAINHSDVVFDNPALHARYLKLIASTDMPWHHRPGNHDMGANPRTSFETWKRTFGPCHHAFQYGDATFIVLNNVERLPPGELTTTRYDYWGQIGTRQLAFVRNVLAHVPGD